MTKPSHGSSLLQARDSHSYSHSKSRSVHRLRHAHSNAHTHARNNNQLAHQHRHDSNTDTTGFDSPSRDDINDSNSPGSSHDGDLAKSDDLIDVNGRDDAQLTHQLDARKPPAVDLAADVKGGQEQSLVTQVIQTVSLIQVVDPNGSPLRKQTQYAPPNTVIVDTKSGKTISVSVPAPSSLMPPGYNPPVSSAPTASSTEFHISTSSPGSHTASESSGSTHPSPHLTTPSAPSAKPSAYPSLNGVHNGTLAAHNVSTTFIPSSNSSMFRQVAFSSPISLSHTRTSTSSSESRSLTYTTTSQVSLSTYDPTTSTIAVATVPIGGNPNAPAPTSGSNPETNPGVLSVQQKQIIGGVVGSVAGVAVVMLLLMLALKYKRRRDGRTMLGDYQSGTSGSGSGPQGGSGGGDSMAERSGAAAVTAAFGALIGKRPNPPAAPAEEGERGFYRVSGRKLPSVLSSGGDGYSDPRESVMSGSTDYYRGSQAFDPMASGATRLALGSPMRPVSGVPIMRSGPARTPVTEQNPFADQHDPFSDPPTPPTPPRESAGRQLVSRGSPNRSTSRFQESI